MNQIIVGTVAIVFSAVFAVTAGVIIDSAKAPESAEAICARQGTFGKEITEFCRALIESKKCGAKP